ncbi:DJ-1/PfpI family protein [Fusobacterium russii]|uniref:DJ-1/PfpI family protein n=1 Tax=Fusobacterium russii TaxID=854 RepID=UPI0003A7C0F7|nr:DJ-1/PfpI family protein [Fusobacterium russii]
MKKIILFLFEGVELLELAFFTDVFGWNNIVGTKNIILETVSYKESVKCSWGGELKVEKVINNQNLKNFLSYDALVIPGGFGKYNFFRDKDNEFFKKLVKHFFEEDKYIFAICSGVLNLLSTSYIKDRNVTTYLLDNKRYFNQLKNYDVSPVEKEVCEDKNLFTCSGAGNSQELALKLLEILTDKENKNKVKENMFLK